MTEQTKARHGQFSLPIIHNLCVQRDDTSLFYKNIHILVGIHQNPYFEPCQGLLTIWTKLFHYHKVNHDNSARSFLMTCHKNQYVIKAKKHSKRNLYCSNINELTWKENKSFKKIIQSVNNTWNRNITSTNEKLISAYDNTIAHWKKKWKKWRKVKTLKNCWTYKSEQEPTALKALLIMRALLV